MKRTRLIHIAPELPPKVGGVADYTVILSQRLVEGSDEAVEPVLIHAGKEPADKIETDFPIKNLSGRCSSADLAETIEGIYRDSDIPVVVLLEYSGYGYSKNGAPLWLARGLQRACGVEGIALISIFHELYATSRKPWERRFWRMLPQYYVARRLARLSDGCLANWDAAARWVRGQVDGTPVRMSPTFSNVGEPKSVPAYSEREPYAVCFGGAGRKEEMYRQHGKSLSHMLRQYGVERILDLGPRPKKKSCDGMAVPVDPKGIQPGEEISSCLKRASLGLLNHPLHCLKKSGVWASHAAHGLPTVLVAESHPIEGLCEGKHFLLSRGGLSTCRCKSISTAVRQWYKGEAHSRKAARRVINLADV